MNKSVVVTVFSFELHDEILCLLERKGIRGLGVMGGVCYDIRCLTEDVFRAKSIIREEGYENNSNISVWPE